jgi:hypothetical protein
MVCKIRLDQSGRFAWAFAGAKPSLFEASLLERRFENGVLDNEIERALRDCGDEGWERGAAGPNDSSVILVDGKTRRMLRATLASKSSMVLQIEEGRCFTGQHYSKASFFPLRYYSPDMSVDQLAELAAYAVVMAGKMDSLIVAGLDIAIYRDSVGRFEFADTQVYSQRAMKVDGEIRRLFTS